MLSSYLRGVIDCFVMLSFMISADAQTSEIKHRFVQVNGIRMHIAEQGEGPLVVLVHGFPELWYSWRHIIPVVAAAGYHVVAPDMRGYGETDAPARVEDYTQLQLVGDIVALVKVLGWIRRSSRDTIGVLPSPRIPPFCGRTFSAPWSC